MSKKEGFWLLGSILAILILLLWLVGPEFLSVSETTDINIHDTYFVISNHYVSALLGVHMLFIVYVVRCLIQRFRNLFPNLVFLVSNLLLIYMYTWIIVLFIDFGQIGRLAGSPLGADSSEMHRNAWGSATSLMCFIQVSLLILLAITAFMTGRNYNRHPKPQ